jgi:HD-GYP domain-containing protein (c-di-GMP phosphodiesterase class II)
VAHILQAPAGIGQQTEQSTEQSTAPSIRVAAVVAALSKALDLSTGQAPGHSIRGCILGMRIGQEYGLAESQLAELYYALLLKDCGCSGNASKTFHALGSDDLKAKRDVKTTDWTRVSWETLQYALSHVAPGKPFLERTKALFRLAANQKAHTRDVTKIRCERGATLARLMGLPEEAAAAILDLDEHWDGSGNPENLRGESIHIYSRIMLLAQTLDNFAVAHSQETALQVIQQRSKKWFDPALVKAALSLARRGELWSDVDDPNVLDLVLTLDTAAARLKFGDNTLDTICVAFAQIVDAKSPFTYNHSNGVANAAVAIGQKLNLPPERIMFVRHAALLHDLGKLGVSNAILEKPSKLDDDEWKIMKRHPEDTWLILRTIPHFGELSEVAASHHEKLNGKGYFRNFTAEQLSTESRIIAVADIFDALSAKRPYREALPLETVFGIMRKEAPHAIDGDCLRALEESGAASDQAYRDLDALNRALAASGITRNK